MRPAIFHTTTLDASPQAEKVRDILSAALKAADPDQATRTALLPFLIHRRQLDSYQRIFVIGCGKAAYPMAKAVEDALPGQITNGIIVTKIGHAPAQPLLSTTQIYEAAHPIPDSSSTEATRALTSLLAQAGENDLVIALISGGGSALLTQPVSGVSLEDLQTLTNLLLRSGAAIQQINTLRKHLDTVKGGGLARLAAPARLITLILSDVVGDPLDAIASGPTVPDPTTFQDAWNILAQFKLLQQTPPAIIRYLQRGLAGTVPETLKPGDPVFSRVQNQIIASNTHAAQAAARQAEEAGFHTRLLTTPLSGEARQAGANLADTLQHAFQSGDPPRPLCLIAGGETTVTVHGHGFGGRNQELALGAVEDLAGLENVLLISLATDGGDGPTDAAGAVVSGDTLRRAIALGMSPSDFLARNDAYHFFSPLGDLLITGPTQTNVNDLALLFAL